MNIFSFASKLCVSVCMRVLSMEMIDGVFIIQQKNSEAVEYKFVGENPLERRWHNVSRRTKDSQGILILARPGEIRTADLCYWLYYV